MEGVMSAKERRSAMEAAGIAPKRGECVRVVVRVRPMSEKERQDGMNMICEVDETAASIAVNNPRGDPSDVPKRFTFDQTFGVRSTQRQVYDRTALPIVESVLEGYNGTVFAYGQTGAGKSFTMEGAADPPELRGIIPHSFKHIFEKIGLGDNQQFLVRASYLEIYNEEIRDLLSKNPRNKLELKESVDTGVYVKDLTAVPVNSVAEIEHVLQMGKKNRVVGATLMNLESSRSHAIFTIVVETAELGVDGKQHIRVGKLNLVDLAGSERQSKTGATGDRLKEAININQSLSALGNVISALVESKATYVPYRDSKLTRLLQDSLGGNTRTVMIANCGPADYNYDETLSTLRYANRAKNIKNKPKINEDPKDAMLREFQEEIARLRQQLDEAGGGAPAGAASAAAEGKEGDVMVVEKVVEKVVVERDTDTEARLRELQLRAEQEKEQLRERTAAEAAALLEQHKKTEEEKAMLEEQLRREQEELQRQAKSRDMLERKLKTMETKLILGGQLMDKAARQEEQLRQAKLELEERKRQELELARSLAKREEANLELEDQYTNLREEVEVKTRKLKKLFGKYKGALQEVKDVEAECQTQREDMLDTIRSLTSQLKLKQLVLDMHIPPEEQERLGRHARWDDASDDWLIPGSERAGNFLRQPKRPASASQNPLRRPESEYCTPDGSPLSSASLPNPYLVYNPDDPMGYSSAAARPQREDARAVARRERPKTGRRTKSKRTTA